MAKIKIAFRQLIDGQSAGDFEKQVFQDSFNEFCMQSQAYNLEGKLKTFQELVHNNPKANSLHYKVGFAVGLYISGLKNIIPGLTDSIGKAVMFDNHEFMIVASHVSNKSHHKVAIIYTTDWIDLLGVTASFLIVGDARTGEGEMSTLTIPWQDNLSVVAWNSEKDQKLNDLEYADKSQLI